MGNVIHGGGRRLSVCTVHPVVPIPVCTLRWYFVESKDVLDVLLTCAWRQEDSDMDPHIFHHSLMIITSQCRSTCPISRHICQHHVAKASTIFSREFAHTSLVRSDAGCIVAQGQNLTAHPFVVSSISQLVSIKRTRVFQGFPMNR